MTKINDNILSDGDLHEAENRIIGLDFIRILLVLLIFAFHSQIHFDCYYYWLNDFVRMGAIAITAFFMLSGYSLILSTSHKDFTKIKDVKQFYIKRLIRILPLYYSVALIRVVMDLMVGKSTFAEVAILFPVELFATQSTFTTLFPYSHNNGTWFISCLIICYIFFPFIQNLFLQLSVKTKTITGVVLCSILFYAPFIQHFFQLNDLSVYTSPFYRLIEFVLGIIIAQINTMPIENKLLLVIRKPIICTLAFVLLVVLVSMGRRFDLPVDYMLYNIVTVPCFLVIITSLGSMRFKSIKRPCFLLYLSNISFTFFLCQVLPLWGISRFLYALISIESNLIRILISFMTCMIGSIAIYYSFEKPATSFLKKKLLKI